MKIFYPSLLILVALASATYGLLVGKYHWWPYDELRIIRAEAQYIVNDLLGDVERILVYSDSASGPGHIPLQESIFGDSAPLVISSADVFDGYTVIHGSFEFDEVEHAALLLDPSGDLIHVWRLREDHNRIPGMRHKYTKYPHGLAVLPDGSLVYAFDFGVSLNRIAFCGDVLWSRVGEYHHAVTLAEDRRSLWTPQRPLHGGSGSQEGLEGFDIAAETRFEQVSVEDGQVLRAFSIRDVMDANPDLDIFGIRQEDNEWGVSAWEEDPFHSNDVDPLPAAMAGAFPAFRAGDVLLSLRSLNLLVVVDPESLKVKWFDFGRMRRQHDPDWQADGTITVLDNNMSREHSRILKIRPGDPDGLETIVDGRDHDFYTAVRGKHQVLDNGNVLVTSSQQGRVFEVDETGGVSFEFLNAYRGDFATRFAVSEALRLPIDYFEEGVLGQCD